MRWVALLRGVNLGARNRVPMAELRVLLEEVGYANVRTYIASGNVIFDGAQSAAALSAGLERLIADRFGVTTTALLRKPRELAETVAGHPFGSDTSDTHVAFLAARPSKAAAARLDAVDSSADLAVLSGAELYLRMPRGVHGSGLSIARIEKLLGVPATLRNWRTVAKLAELAADT